MHKRFLGILTCAAIAFATQGQSACQNSTSPSESSPSTSSASTNTGTVEVRVTSGTTYRLRGTTFRFIDFDGASSDIGRSFRLADCTLRSYNYSSYSTIEYAGDTVGACYTSPVTTLVINGTRVWSNSKINGVRGTDTVDGSTRSIGWSAFVSATFR